ncbi:hypothetical protein GF339_07325 [candidate division KSB3 bacterium]|uniref:Outer membrane protein beta-barrel domain-containing protein n=1 Tax=candidate division KSB3 bacterium TaxID=2044937 RepID=A0A9D5JUG6_9BACT|nr:hypothetical protein [candidate division KSB3 bacterium]MBD3324380.1 hypothetical protein [candidate division KSB3 bacterium]
MTPTCCYARATGIRHEISTSFQWTTDRYTYDTYVINGERLPEITGDLDQEYTLQTASYTFFFTPVPEDSATPIPLRQFYARPTSLRAFIAVQPEAETTSRFSNPENAYISSSSTDVRARMAGVDLNYYLRDTLGLVLHLSSHKYEEDERTSTTLGNRGAGENDEIQRYYGAGLSYYPWNHVNLRLMYTGAEFDYVGTHRTWEEGNAFLFRGVDREITTDGYTLTLTGRAILRTFIDIQWQYEFQDHEGHSDVLTSYSDTFPGTESSYDATRATHRVGTTVRLYVGEKTSVRLGGSFAAQTLERDYETDQIVEYEWDITTLETGISYYLTRHIGMHLGYEYHTRTGDVLIWHPDTESDPRTEYEAHADAHAVTVSIIGRF